MIREIKKLRAYRGVTQEDLAKHLGVSKARVSVIENNEEKVALGQLLEIYNFLGYDLIVKDIKEER